YAAGEIAPAFGIELKHQYVTVKNLDTEEDTIVNMTKVNTIGDNPRVQTIDDPELLRRFLYVDNAKLGNNTTFKVGIYGYTGEENGKKTGGVADVIMLKNINNEGTADAEKETINIALGYVPELKDLTAKSGEVILDKGTSADAKNATWVLAYSNAQDIEKVKVVGVASQADGIFDSYTITPVVNTSYGSQDSINSMGVRVESYTYEKSGIAENVKALADFHVTGDKVVRLQQDSFFRNAGGRELIDRHQDGAEHDNNVWADYYHGKVSSSSTYGRHISQSYNGYQVGYDTLMVPNYKNGNIYVGAYLSKIDSDSTIASGKGELDSVGFGLYGTWAGNRGHYIDGVISVNDLDNEFNYVNNMDGKVNGDYSHRYYTAAAQYGYRKHYDNGFFVEPKLSMSIGYGEAAEYQLSNGINAKMDDYKNIIGKAGAYVGKEFGNKGNVYVGAFYAHNYAKDMKGVLSYESSGKTATKDLDVVDLEDTWYEFNIGAKYALSPVSNIAVDYIKQTGSDIGNDWSLNCSYQLKF
ncbi:MAG: autotransporter outer membrane beta-barrel domain-containing protein, partial [Bacteroidia bacterium]|nr:autotransporter outer membrane beta-barrel domain-containing protein [Bacteroidia bacterium]